VEWNPQRSTATQEGRGGERSGRGRGREELRTEWGRIGRGGMEVFDRDSSEISSDKFGSEAIDGIGFG